MIEARQLEHVLMKLLEKPKDSPFPVQFTKLSTYNRAQRKQIAEVLRQQPQTAQAKLVGLTNGLEWLRERDQLLEQLQQSEKKISMLPATIVAEQSEQYEHLTTLLTYRTNLECPTEVLLSSAYEELSPRAFMFFMPSLLAACLEAEQTPSPLFSLVFKRLCTLNDFYISRFTYCFDRTSIQQFLQLYQKNPYFEQYHEQIRRSLAHYWE